MKLHNILAAAAIALLTSSCGYNAEYMTAKLERTSDHDLLNYYSLGRHQRPENISEIAISEATKRGLVSRKDAESIRHGKIRIGMGPNAVRMAWGRPYDINRTLSAYSGTSEQWVYSRSYVYFENGRVTTIQN